MSHPQRGAMIGAAAMVLYLLIRFGLPPLAIFLDGFILLLAITLILFAAAIGSGLVLAWRHVARRPLILAPTVLVLLCLTLPLVLGYRRALRATPAFLASADSVRALINGRNVFGNLLITYRPDSAHLARAIADRKRAHNRLDQGDSIWVYVQREPPHAIEVWPPGPDAYYFARRLLWGWFIGGVLLASYVPLVRSWFRKAPSQSPESR